VEEVTTVVEPPPVRVRIDLNARSRDGYVRARASRADGPVAAGDRVVAYEPEDRVAAPAVVVRTDLERGLVYLAVDWAALAEDNVPLLAVPQMVGSQVY